MRLVELSDRGHVCLSVVSGLARMWRLVCECAVVRMAERVRVAERPHGASGLGGRQMACVRVAGRVNGAV